jgi:hypothetical protein
MCWGCRRRFLTGGHLERELQHVGLDRLALRALMASERMPLPELEPGEAAAEPLGLGDLATLPPFVTARELPQHLEWPVCAALLRLAVRGRRSGRGQTG